MCVCKQKTAYEMRISDWSADVCSSDLGQPTAAMTRWRVSALPSPALPVPGVGRHRWLVELIRARAGERADLELEACDDTGCLALPAHMVDRSLAQEGRRHGASGRGAARPAWPGQEKAGLAGGGGGGTGRRRAHRVGDE